MYTLFKQDTFVTMWMVTNDRYSRV